MARKPSYGRERSERTRAKQAKRDAKVEQRQAAAAARKAADTGPPGLLEAVSPLTDATSDALERSIPQPPRGEPGVRPDESRRIAPPTHKFDVGRIVRSEPDPDRGIPPGTFEVMRHLPSDDATRALQYRIKATVDGHERIVLESDLR